MCVCVCLVYSGFKLVKQNRFTKMSEHSEEKGPIQQKISSNINKLTKKEIKRMSQEMPERK